MKTVAIIGCGKSVEGHQGFAIGHAHAAGYQNCGEAVKLYGVDLSPENLAAFGSKFNLPAEQLFASTDALYAALTPDVVSICTWPGLHASMALDAIDQGAKALIIEKPLALDVDQINALRAKAKETGTVVAVAHQRRYEPYFQMLKKIVDSGELGLPIRVEAHVGDDWDILSWTTHWFDMANFLFGEAPQYVLAGMDVTDKRLYGHAVENASIVFAEYDENRNAVFLTGPQASGSLKLVGPKGITIAKEDAVLLCTEDGVETLPLNKSKFEDGFAHLCSEVIQSLDSGNEPLCSITNCAAATEMAYAAHESVSTARKVALPASVGFAPLEVMQRPPVSRLKGKRVLLHADTHFGSGGREGLAETLEALTGLAPVVIDAEERGLTASDLRDVDFIAIYHTQEEADEETRAALENWVDRGHPLCVVHAGLGAYPEWERYHAWCGYAWEWGVSYHPYESTTLEVTAGNPLDLTHAGSWLPRDEVFVALKETAPVTVGLTAKLSNGDTFPAAWLSQNEANVGGWMPGHRRDSWTLPAMRSGLEELILATMG